MLEEDSYIGLAYDPTNMSVMWPAGTLGAKPLVKFYCSLLMHKTLSLCFTGRHIGFSETFKTRSNFLFSIRLMNFVIFLITAL